MKTRMTELLGIQYPIMQGGSRHLGVPNWQLPYQKQAVLEPLM